MDRSAGGRDGRSRTKTSNHAKSGRASRHSARLPDLPAAVEPVHATAGVVVETIRYAATAESRHRQLRRRPGDLLQGHGRSRHADDARGDQETATGGQRRQDPHLPCTGRKLRLPGLHVRTVLLPQDREGLSEYDAIEEEHQANLRCDQCRDWPTHEDDISRETGDATQPQTERMGELLPSWASL